MNMIQSNQQVPKLDEADDCSVMLVEIKPMPTQERQTSWKYKDIDPCYKWQRSASSSSEDIMDNSKRNEENRDAQYKD
jgi:hypothetical protein